MPPSTITITTKKNMSILLCDFDVVNENTQKEAESPKKRGEATTEVNKMVDVDRSYCGGVPIGLSL